MMGISPPQRARARYVCLGLVTLAWMACKSAEQGAPPPPDPSPPDLLAAASLTAIASAPEVVSAYATVLLDGSYSTALSGKITTYAWKQTAGPAASLTGADLATASFVAPMVTQQTEFTFSLSVGDGSGAMAGASATVRVVPAAAADLLPQFVELALLQTFTGNVHNALTPWDGPPLVGATLTLQATLSGAVATPKFTLADNMGAVLATPSLPLTGSPWLQPLTFLGPVQIPAVPFKLVATGTSADGKPYSLSSAVITPMKMTLAFDPPSVLVAPGASRMVSLQVYNGGADATFAVTFSDPSRLLASAAGVMVPVAAGKTGTVPLTITQPVAAEALNPNPTLQATAAVAGDTSRSGTVTLQAWRNGAP